VNEIQLIRAQLATERAHVRKIAAACDEPGDARARHDYLRNVLGWFAARDERLEQLLRAPDRLGADARAALASVLSDSGDSREALRRLPAPADGSAQAWHQFAQFMTDTWDLRRQRLDALLAQESAAATWRAIAGIDADTVLEERARYARARAAC
jgi:hypothetical protein